MKRVAALLILLVLPGLAAADQGIRGAITFDPFMTPWEQALLVLDIDPPYCTVWSLSGDEVSSFQADLDPNTGEYVQSLDPGDWKIHCVHFYRAYGKWSGGALTFDEASVISVTAGVFDDGIDFALPHRPFLEPFLNGDIFTTGETLVSDLLLANGPEERELFVTFEMLLPASGLSSYSPIGQRRVVISRTVSLAPYQSTMVTDFFSYTFTGLEPAGTYLIRAAWTDIGEYVSDVLSDQSSQGFEIQFTP